jgi:hypothetical protein
MRIVASPRSCLLAGLAMALAACGGGGGGGGNNNPPPPPPALNITTTSLAAGVVGSAYSQTVAATGGTTPRTFSISAGILPAGLALAANGVISGTPAGGPGTSDFTVTVTDSASPAVSDAQALSIRINAAAPRRNDSIADATPLGNGTHAASISPAGDPSGTFDPDEDYYSVTTTTDSIVTVDIDAQVNGSPVDTVIEIVNASGTQLNRCVAPAYASPCESDDEQPGVSLDSLLQVQVNGATTFYIHVVDWGSNARPDMLYDLKLSGVN